LLHRLDGASASRHFKRLDGVAAAPADPETMMTFIRLIAGRHSIVRGVLGAVLLLLASGPGSPADQFPFDQELVLDAAPMRPAKRVPILSVMPDGNASIDLWCKTVTARVELSDAAIKIEPGPLPEGLPEMMSEGQCTSARLGADADMLAALVQMTAWRMQGSALVLEGPKTLKFRPSDH
jgi:heat shock protein HslJ